MLDECRALTNDDLSRDLKFLAQRDRHCMAKILAHLAEYDRRGLSVKETHYSLFIYCVKILGYDEFDAYRRIRAARTAVKFPQILDLLEQGKLSLTAIVALHPYLTEENHRAWFAVVAGKSRRQIETLIAERHPQGARSDVLRRFPAAPMQYAPPAPPIAADLVTGGASAPDMPLPAVSEHDAGGDGDTAGGPPARPHEWQAIVPVSMDRVRIGFDAGLDVMRMIDRARQLLRHKYPAGRLEDVMTDVLQIFLDRKDPQRRLTLKAAPDAAPETPPREPRLLRDAKAGRYIPAWVKRVVWERDGGRCAWRFEDGTLCGSKDWTEFDHVKPFAKGGRSDSPRNIRLLCRLHNALAARAAGLSAAGGRA